jgi:hypothetical protein
MFGPKKVFNDASHFEGIFRFHQKPIKIKRLKEKGSYGQHQ